MSEFDIFTIQTKIQQNTAKIDTLKRVINQIKQNDQHVQVTSVERVNKVAMFAVVIPHTSQYMIKLGNGYYAKVKTNAALELLNSRKKFNEQQNQKWIELKNNLMKEKQIRERQSDNLNNDVRKMEVIGQNDQGEQIFNIMEFGDSVDHGRDFGGKKQLCPQTLKLPTIFEQTQDKNDGQKHQQTQINQNASIEKQKITHQQAESDYKQIPQQKPKKISKFKAERMQAAKKQ